jgi:hypothetical protein
MTDRPVAEENGLPSRKCILGVFIFQITALTAVAWFFRHSLNPDAVAYLRIASYYAGHETSLAVSGYWSPLISWMIVPILKMGVPPLAAARIVMELSAILFLFGCLQVFRRFKLPRTFSCVGLWISALVSIPWSVENITPDLLLAALVSFAVAGMVTPRWFLKRRRALLSGIFWGIAYLSKSIALPFGILTSVGVGVFWWWRGGGARQNIAACSCLALLGIGMVSVPWIAVLSRHYGKLTVANSAVMNHSLVGPAVTNRLYLLDQGFHRPEAGRVTVWEDPALPYPDWSPLDNWGNALHQLWIVLRNVPVAVVMLSSTSLSFPFLAAILLMRRLRFGFNTADCPGVCRALFPVLVLTAFYLPNHLLIYEQRYFYPAFPFLYVATVRMLFSICISYWPGIQRRGVALVLVCFLVPTIARSCLHLNSTRVAGKCACDLAQRISRAGIDGPIAGSGRLPGGRAGLYTAYLLDQPWFGDVSHPDASSFRQSGAKLVIVRRGDDVTHELSVSGGFRNLDPLLFESSDDAARFPLQVFEVVPVDYHPAANRPGGGGLK